MLRLEHYSSCMTHLSWQTSHPQQRSYMVVQLKAQPFQDHPRGSTYIRSDRLVELQEKQKEQFDRAHRAKDLHPLKVREQVQFFHNKQGTGRIKWMTGTVTEILECGCSYMIQVPNGRVYRRNRAHLKPICHDGSSFQDHPVKKRKKQPKDNSFQDHQTSQARSMSFDNEVSYIDNGVSYMDTQSMMFDEPDTCQTPPMPPSCSPPALSPLGATHLDHHHIHHQHHFHPESHPSSPVQRTPHPKAGRDTSLNQLSSDPEDIDQGLTCGLSALLAETSPLAPYRLQ